MWSGLPIPIQWALMVTLHSIKSCEYICLTCSYASNCLSQVWWPVPLMPYISIQTREVNAESDAVITLLGATEISARLSVGSVTGTIMPWVCSWSSSAHSFSLDAKVNMTGVCWCKTVLCCRLATCGFFFVLHCFNDSNEHLRELLLGCQKWGWTDLVFWCYWHCM